VNPVDLRLACKCAVCVEELTGRPLLDPKSVVQQGASYGCTPLDFGPVGNYALVSVVSVCIVWIDELCVRVCDVNMREK
jgi:hypothetical protein